METKVYYGEYSLEYWIKILLTKNIELPNYQRSFVWDENQVLRLLNSIKEGQFIPPITIGGFYDSNGKLTNYVIDGQQRLTSILLGYLQIYPKKEVFADRNEQMVNSEVAPVDGQEEDASFILEWTFRELQKKGYNKSDILSLCPSSDYDHFSSSDDFQNTEFLKSHFLGFSYIVPKVNSKEEQQRFYSKLFRDINIQGSKLKAQESRRSLYFMRDEYEDFFEPKFMSKYGLLIGKAFVHIDFVRYLSFTTNYAHRNNVHSVARTYWRDYEPYYERYVYAVVQNEKDEMFGLFTSLFPTEAARNSAMDELKRTLLDIEIPKEFKNYMSMDMYMFGLVYYVLIKRKHINKDSIPHLIRDIENKIATYGRDNLHTFAPNMISKIRMRLFDSIEIYGRYVL